MWWPTWSRSGVGSTQARVRRGALLSSLWWTAGRPLSTGWKRDWALAKSELGKNLRRPAAQALVGQLYEKNALGYEAKETMSMLKEVVEWKEKDSEKVILVRVGDFYESWGVDAVMLVEHAGLNSMGGKPRAGCPWRNVQATLDCLTAQGLSIAVYEEDDRRRGSKKKRSLAQIVTPGSPVYVVRDSQLDDTEYDFNRGVPYACIRVSGYRVDVACLDVDARVATVARGLTKDGALSLLRDVASPLYYAGPLSKKFAHDFFEGKDTQCLLENDSLVDALVRAVAERLRYSVEDFFSSANTVRVKTLDRPPILASTAREIGLLEASVFDPEVPSLADALAESTPSKNWLRKWVLSSPSVRATESMRSAQLKLSTSLDSFPKLPLTVGRRKIVRLLADGEASASFFKQLSSNCRVAASLMERDPARCVDDLLRVSREEHGSSVAKFTREQLYTKARNVSEAIAHVIDSDPVFLDNTNTNKDESKEPRFDAAVLDDDDDCSIPAACLAYFQKNEAPFSGVVRRERLANARDRLDKSKLQVLAALENEPDRTSQQLTFDQLNNVLAWKGSGPGITPMDRYGKPLEKKRTSKKLQEATSEFVAACLECADSTREQLRELARLLYATHLDEIISCCSLNEVASSAIDHASVASRLQWAHASLDEDEKKMHFHGLRPYWLEHGTENDVALRPSETAVLTGPNAAGKSTLLRATAAAALLASRGLRVPAVTARVPHIDTIFLRAAGRGDAPAQGKSSFAREMDDVATLLNECTDNSLILVDEIGKGTAPSEAAAIAASLVTEFDLRRYRGIFATHLHAELLPLLEKHSTKNKERPFWRMDAYVKKRGVCSDALSLQCAENAGVPRSVLDRARNFLVVPVAPTNNARQPAVSSSKQETLGVTSSLGESSGEKERKNPPDHHWATVQKTVGDLTREGTILSVAAGDRAPPALSGQSCLYVLRLSNSFYVGESDALADRLATHRRSRNFSEALVAPVADKTTARTLETTLIRRLHDLGVPLDSTADANRRLVRQSS